MNSLVPKDIPLPAERSLLLSRLKDQVVRYLRSDKAAHIEYESGHERVGQHRFVVGTSQDGSTDFVVEAVAHSDSNLKPVIDIGLRRYDFLEIRSMDKKRKTAGQIQIIQREEGIMGVTRHQVGIIDRHINYWDEGGAILFIVIGREMTLDEISQLVNNMETGNANEELTQKCLPILGKDFPFKLINRQTTSSH